MVVLKRVLRKLELDGHLSWKEARGQSTSLKRIIGNPRKSQQLVSPICRDFHLGLLSLSDSRGRIGQ